MKPCPAPLSGPWGRNHPAEAKAGGRSGSPTIHHENDPRSTSRAALLLDTHVALWGLAAAPELSLDLLVRLPHDPDVFLSPVTRWEITMKQRAGKLGGPPDLVERVRDMGFRPLPITADHAITAGRLPDHHRDPFDRMLIAQATVERLTLVTRDADIRRYDLDVLVV